MATKRPIANYSGTPQEIPDTDKLPVAVLPVMVASGGSHAAGIVPDPGSTTGANKFLREDATFQNMNGLAYAFSRGIVNF